MRKRRAYLAAACVAIVASLVVAGFATAGSSRSEATKVTVQLKWVTQAQFAGFYAAQEKGYYEKLGLDVTIKLGGPDIIPEQVVLGKQADFGVDWLPSLLSFRDKGNDLVNIAQVFTRSGMLELTHKDSGIESIADLRGKKVGVWCCGNENELYAALTKNGIDLKDDVTIVNQPFNMNLFLERQVDAAAAMTYNELAQVLETENPETNELYTLDDLNVISMEDAGTAMLEDGLFVRGDWLEEEGNEDVAKRFLKASFKGWAFCRDSQDECLQIVLDNGTTLPEGHQRWQLNEINALIWPTPDGIGVMDEEAFQRTADIAKQFEVIKAEPADGAYRTDLAEAAVDELEGEDVDVKGEDWQKETVELTAGGK